MKFASYLTIKEALTEGGNSTLGGVKAQSIPLKLFKDPDQVREFQEELKKALKLLSLEFEKVNGSELWSKEIQFSGSTDKFFSGEEGVLKRFLASKDEVGDIDTQISSKWFEKVDGGKISIIANFLNDMKGKDLNGFNVRDSDKTGQYAQFETPDKWKAIVDNLQVDFESAQFTDDGEADEFSKFAYSSHMEDIEKGIKGFHHKYLFGSIIGNASKQGSVVLTPTLKGIEKNKGKPSIGDQKTKTFSQTTGVRADVIPVTPEELESLSPAAKNAIKALSDEHKVLPILRRIKKEERIPNSMREVKQFFPLMFGGGDATDEEFGKMWSFSGLLDLMKENLDRDKQKQVLASYVFKLWGLSDDGSTSQNVLSKDPIQGDKSVKLKGYELAMKELNNPLDDGKVKQMIETYYSVTPSFNEKSSDFKERIEPVIGINLDEVITDSRKPGYDGSSPIQKATRKSYNSIVKREANSEKELEANV